MYTNSQRRAALARLNKEKRTMPAASPASSTTKHPSPRYHRQQPRPLPASALDYGEGLRGKASALEAWAAALEGA